MSAKQSMADLAAFVETWLTGFEELQELQVADHFATKAGGLGDMELTLSTRRFETPKLEMLTLALMHDQQQQVISVTLSAIPRVHWQLPILGLDFVAFKNRLSLAAMDLCPLNRDLISWREHSEPLLAGLEEQYGQCWQQRARPDFVERCFSPSAILATANEGTEAQVCDAAQALLRGYSALYEQAAANAPAEDYQGSVDWRLAMRDNRKEQKALSKIFGEEWTHEYLDGFLFAVAE